MFNITKKVLLITPPYHCGVLESAGSWLHVGFVYIAGSLRKAGFDVEIYDAMTKFHTLEEIRAKIEEVKPDVVGSTAYTASIYEGINVLRVAKEVDPSILTFIGGVHATFCADEVLQDEHDCVDYVIRGEGEVTATDLLTHVFSDSNISDVSGISYWEDGVVSTPDRPFIEDLDTLSPAWDLVEWADYSFRTKKDSILAVVSSSRGCMEKCSFCSQQLFWKRTWRGRSPENFVSELEHLNKEYGVDVAMIADEIPTFDRDRWVQILDLLIEKDLDVEILMETRVDDILRDEDILDKYYKAKILHIYVGVESASQDTLEVFNKNLMIDQSKRAIELINKAGIISETSFVLGMPNDTKESIQKAVDLAKHYNPDLAFFLAIAPWPYSEIYDILKPHVKVFDYSKYNLVAPVVKPEKMTLEELDQSLLNAFREFYTFKLSNLDKMSDFKRNYMIEVTKLLVNHSYLADQMKGVGEMPEEISNLLNGILDD